MDEKKEKKITPASHRDKRPSDSKCVAFSAPRRDRAPYTAETSAYSTGHASRIVTPPISALSPTWPGAPPAPTRSRLPTTLRGQFTRCRPFRPFRPPLPPFSTPFPPPPHVPFTGAARATSPGVALFKPTPPASVLSQLLDTPPISIKGRRRQLRRKINFLGPNQNPFPNTHFAEPLLFPHNNL